MWSRSLTLVVASLGAVALTACGSGGASPETKIVPVRALNVQVCMEGEARDAKLYLKNLDDFEWDDYTFSVIKNGKEYSYATHPFNMEDPDIAESWPPEAQQTSKAFATSRDFFYDPPREDDVSHDVMAGSHSRTVLSRMHNFSALEGAKVVISKPFLGEWTGEVQTCA